MIKDIGKNVYSHPSPLENFSSLCGRSGDYVWTAQPDVLPGYNT
jgi:hypothetical protein